MRPRPPPCHRPPLGAVLQREIFRLLFEAEDQRHDIVSQREDGAGFHGIPCDQAHHVGEGEADVGVQEVPHGHRAVRPHLDPRLGDDTELPVAEEDAFQVVVAFLDANDLAGRRDDLELDRLIRGAAVARRVDVDAADAERAADRGQHVERRARVVEAAQATPAALRRTFAPRRMPASTHAVAPSQSINRFMPLTSSRMPAPLTDSPSVVSPPPRHVTGMRSPCASRSTSATSSGQRAWTTASGRP